MEDGDLAAAATEGQHDSGNSGLAMPATFFRADLELASSYLAEGAHANWVAPVEAGDLFPLEVEPPDSHQLSTDNRRHLAEGDSFQEGKVRNCRIPVEDRS